MWASRDLTDSTAARTEPGAPSRGLHVISYLSFESTSDRLADSTLDLLRLTRFRLDSTMINFGWNTEDADLVALRDKLAPNYDDVAKQLNLLHKMGRTEAWVQRRAKDLEGELLSRSTRMLAQHPSADFGFIDQIRQTLKAQQLDGATHSFSPSLLR